MSCYGCKCDTCARNAELSLLYFTPGEVGTVSDICYCCDDCVEYVGAPMQSLLKKDCDDYAEARKYTEMRARNLQMKFELMNGEKYMKQPEGTYKVSTPGHDPVLVTGSEKLDIVQAAARLWHVPWTSVARACVITPVSKK